MITSSQKFSKKESDVLDFGINWVDWLGDDTIFSSQWAVESGITVDSESHDTTTATLTLSGGEKGDKYIATNTITTSQGLTKSDYIVISVLS